MLENIWADNFPQVKYAKDASRISRDAGAAWHAERKMEVNLGVYVIRYDGRRKEK